MSAYAAEFRELTGSLFLAAKLRDPTVFLGVTTNEETRAKLRALVLERGADEIAYYAKQSGRPVTFGQIYERVYGVPPIEDTIPCEN